MTAKIIKNKGMSVRLSREVVEKLKAMAHPGQTLDGVVRELLQKLSEGHG